MLICFHKPQPAYHMRKFLLTIIVLALVQLSFSQSVVKGKVSDTLEKRNLQNAVVSILKRSDSSLVQFARTAKSGEFQIDNVDSGKYVLLITYPGFADYADYIEISNQPITDLGSIPLTLKSKLLDAVIIKSAGAVRIKGDTTEFVADSFKLKEGATVEDLLKRLPGFQVNSKGEVTAQGQKVGKVLVDGEEFFGDDPTMATQNINAKAVDKVQVYDTKSDQQNLTGISTGNEGKTVNIKLKENAKKGSFGKAYVGSDFKKLVDAKALYNKFVGKKKLSLYGTKSDISTGSLNWEDRQKLGIENDWEYDEISGYYYGFDNNDEFDDWSLKGLPHSYTAGALFTNKWNADKNNFNGSYRYNRLSTNNEASTLTQNILSNSTTYRNKFQNSKGLVWQHAATIKYEWKIDSLASLKFTTSGIYKTNQLKSDINSEFLDSNRQYINKNEQLVDNETQKKQSDNQLQYKQLFKKKNRILIATLRFGYIEDTQDGVIKTNTDFYKNGIVDSTDIADQQKLRNGHSKTLGSKITFSEPLNTKWAIVLEYAYNKNSSVSHRNTFNKDFYGKYSVLDKTFSNNFDLDVYSNGGTAILKYTTQKLRAAFGSGVSSVKLKLFNSDSNKRSNYDFFNLTPQASIGYTFKPQTRISFNYRGSTRQPSIDQLQPIRDNQDRLNIFIGNPDLKVGFNHELSMYFNTYKMLSQKGVFTNFYIDIPVNAITFLNSVDVTTGQQTYKPVNVNGNRNWGSWFQYFKDGGSKKWGYYAGLNGNGGTNNNFISQIMNGNVQQLKNRTNYINSNFEFSLRYNIPDTFEISFGPKAGYNISKSSLQKNYNSNYWNYGGRISGMILLPGKLEFNTDCDFDLRQHLSAFGGNPNQIIWNASLARKVLKDKSGKIYIIANDILDQRKGFNRNFTSNFISEERFSRISRYFLLKFEWSFNKMPGQSTK
jgi:hypothetical protein